MFDLLTHLRRQLSHRYRALEYALENGLDLVAATSVLGSRPTAAWQAHHIGSAIASTHRAVLEDPPGDWCVALERGPTPPADERAWRAQKASVLAGAEGLLSGLGRLDPGALDTPPLVPIHPSFREHLTTRGRFLEGHLYHVTYHLGALGVLRAEFLRDPEEP